MSIERCAKHGSWDSDMQEWCPRCDAELAKEPSIARDCKHGNLARSCTLCELESALAESRQEVERLRKALEKLMVVNEAILWGHIAYNAEAQIGTQPKGGSRERTKERA